MRLRNLFLSDMRFQARYGFYFLYAVLTAVYVLILFAMPETWREKAAAIFIFSAPASMGLFFMGAIVLLEKSQRTPCALAVSPVRAEEYILAKVGSLSVISVVVAAVLALVASVKKEPVQQFCVPVALSIHAPRSLFACMYSNLGPFFHGTFVTGDVMGTSAKQLCIVLSGTVISSVIFTLLGIIAATKTVSLNQYILWTVPIEAACFIPAVLHLFKVTPAWLQYYPINVCMEMISGAAPPAAGMVIVMALLAILFVFSKDCVLKMWSSTGGVKL